MKKLLVWDTLSVSHDGDPSIIAGNTSTNLADIGEIIGAGTYLLANNNGIAWKAINGLANNAMFIVNTKETTNFSEVIVASDSSQNFAYSIRVVYDFAKVSMPGEGQCGQVIALSGNFYVETACIA